MAFRKFIFRAIFLAPGVFLTFSALSGYGSALAIEKAFPVPDYLKINISLPQTDYKTAASTLIAVDVRDGDIGILQAESAVKADVPASEIIPRLELALAHAPSDARGWTLLAELRTPIDSSSAAAALGVALDLSPSNYWLAARQAKDGVNLWKVLPEATKDALARQAHVLWTQQDLRPQIRPLLQTRAGVDLMMRAFANQPNELRALNRWLAVERRRDARSDH